MFSAWQLLAVTLECKWSSNVMIIFQIGWKSWPVFWVTWRGIQNCGSMCSLQQLDSCSSKVPQWKKWQHQFGWRYVHYLIFILLIDHNNNTYQISCLSIWSVHVCSIILCWSMSNPFLPCTDYFTWCFNTELIFGQIMKTYNFFGDVIVGILLFMINVSSLVVYKKKVNHVQVHVNNSDSAKRREKKLFIQCLASSAYYLFACCVFIYVSINFLTVHMTIHPLTHVIWISLHMDSSVIYLIVNKGIKEHSTQTWKKFARKNA